MPSTLVDLPGEVLMSICSHLCLCPKCTSDISTYPYRKRGSSYLSSPYSTVPASPVDRFKTKGLRGLCLTNRILYNTAQPYLYHFPAIEYKPQTIIKLYRTVVQLRPDLAACIRMLPPWSFEASEYFLHASPPLLDCDMIQHNLEDEGVVVDRSSANLLQATLIDVHDGSRKSATGPTADPSNQYEWKQKSYLYLEFAAAYAAHKILAQTNNLSTLFLRHVDAPKFRAVLQPSYMPRTFLENLRECYLLPGHAAGYVPSLLSYFDLLSILFRNAPSLRVLGIERGDYEYGFMAKGDEVRRFGCQIPITRLEIHYRGGDADGILDFGLSETSLFHWMMEAPNLEQLYFIGAGPCRKRPGLSLYFDPLVTTLSCLLDTLVGHGVIKEGIGRTVRRLAFIHSSCIPTTDTQRENFLKWFYREARYQEVGRHIVFSAFPKLEILDISVPLLQILPITRLLEGDNLRELRIHGAQTFDEESHPTLEAILSDVWTPMRDPGPVRLQRVLLNDMDFKHQIMQELDERKGLAGGPFPRFKRVPNRVLLRELNCEKI